MHEYKHELSIGVCVCKPVLAKVTLWIWYVCVLPMFRNDSEAVSSLSVPHTDLSCQTTTGQQHAVTRQTLYVLGRERERTQRRDTRKYPCK